MFIDPIQQIGTLNNASTIKQVSNTTGETQVPFKSFFTDAIDNVNETATALDTETVKLATGESDDLHNYTIASTKYSMAVDLFVQIRNKALDSYKELMNMNI